MSSLAIVGIFYDGYEDIWRDFVNIFNKFWIDCPYNLYIVNSELKIENDSNYNLDRIKVLHAGKGTEYSKKVKYAIDNIEEDYFLLLLEDFFFGLDRNIERINYIFDFILKNHIDYYSMPMKQFVFRKAKVKYGSEKDVYKISPTKQYIYNCQPTIWNKEYLKLLIGDGNYNAWVFEGVYSCDSFIRNKDYLKYSVIDYSNPFNILHGAVQGKFVRRTVKYFLKNGYHFTSKREQISRYKTFKAFISYHLRIFLSYIHLLQIIRKFYGKSVLNKYDTEIKKESSNLLNKEKFDNFYKNKTGM